MSCAIVRFLLRVLCSFLNSCSHFALMLSIFFSPIFIQYCSFLLLVDTVMLYIVYYVYTLKYCCTAIESIPWIVFYLFDLQSFFWWPLFCSCLVVSASDQVQLLCFFSNRSHSLFPASMYCALIVSFSLIFQRRYALQLYINYNIYIYIFVSI